jgi:membrane-associated phospholipid phosphatase
LFRQRLGQVYLYAKCKLLHAERSNLQTLFDAYSIFSLLIPNSYYLLRFNTINDSIPNDFNLRRLGKAHAPGEGKEGGEAGRHDFSESAPSGHKATALTFSSGGPLTLPKYTARYWLLD